MSGPAYTPDCYFNPKEIAQMEQPELDSRRVILSRSEQAKSDATNTLPWGLGCLESTPPLDKPQVTGVNSTLQQRQSSHGEFTQNSVVMQKLKSICYNSPNHAHLEMYQKEAIDMICHKLGRILTGDPNFVDHWHDISGYATLVENILTTGQSHPAVK